MKHILEDQGTYCKEALEFAEREEWKEEISERGSKSLDVQDRAGG